MTGGNAMESLAKVPGAQGALSNTNVDFFGPAYSVRKADELLSWLQNRSGMTPEEKDRAMLMFQNHDADPVGRWTMVGNNPGTGGTIPQGGSTLAEQVRVLGGENTVHNCYGNGGVKCEKFWNDSPEKRPVSQPARPELLKIPVTP